MGKTHQSPKFKKFLNESKGLTPENLAQLYNKVFQDSSNNQIALISNHLGELGLTIADKKGIYQRAVLTGAPEKVLRIFNWIRKISAETMELDSYFEIKGRFKSEKI